MHPKSSLPSIEARIEALSALGKAMFRLSKASHHRVFEEAQQAQRWFSKASIRAALAHWHTCLQPTSLADWIAPYGALMPEKSKRIGLITAGNIPLVGLHDLVCVLIAGHQAHIKISTRDAPLMRWAIDVLKSALPAWRDAITEPQHLHDIDAFIGTGANRTATILRQYFGSIPHIIRGHRSAVAWLTGDETPATLKKLGKDVFTYFGKGCRNVSLLLIPTHFDLKTLVAAWMPFAESLTAHSPYMNNYQYQRALALMNKETHLDGDFFLLKEKKDLNFGKSVDSITGTISYTYYTDKDSVLKALQGHKNTLQCVVCAQSNGAPKASSFWVPFGKTQQPRLCDYADQVDTMAFLKNATK